MQCVYSFWDICFVPTTTTASLFGFKDFIAALALLIIIHTISDIRYRFRVSVAPAPLLKLSYILIGLIGFGTLATDIWINQQWLVPESLMTATIWEGTLAMLFLSLVITWMHYAFIRPPIFGRNNYEKYAQALYQVVLRGSDTELPIIVHELARSVKPLVMFAADLPKIKTDQEEQQKPSAEGYANDILLLIANRRFCRHLVASSQVTAIRFLNAVAESKVYYNVPIGLFAQNVSTEAILNKDSGLYHEDEGFYSGLLGHIKPFSQALYGNYEMVEALREHSPLDIHYKVVWDLDADQFETYCRVVQMTFKSYLEGGHWNQHTYVLTRALMDIKENTCRAIREIRDESDGDSEDAWSRLHVGIGFIEDSISAIGEIEPPLPRRNLRNRDRKRRWFNEDFYDRLAETMSDIIFAAATIDGPPDRAWSVHYNSVWYYFFNYGSVNKAWKTVRFKLRRLLYNEIRHLETIPNYKSARVLGICLNVMGLKMDKRAGYGQEHAALKSAVLAWTRRNYLTLRETNEDIANTCLIGGITFDAGQTRLVKTYAKGLQPEPSRGYLPLLSRPAAT